MKIKVRTMLLTRDSESEFEVPEGAANATVTVHSAGSEVWACLTWLELTTKERLDLMYQQQQRGGR